MNLLRAITVGARGVWHRLDSLGTFGTVATRYTRSQGRRRHPARPLQVTTGLHVKSSFSFSPPYALCAVVAALSLLSACGGGGGAAAPVVPPVVVPPVTPSTACSVPAAPERPATTVSVRSFGAIPDDGLDDTDAIQAAINSLTPGQWLVFPAGTYLQGHGLEVNNPNVVLWSEGATLHATAPDDTALVVQADGVGIYNFRFTAETGGRLFAPWHARIAIYDLSGAGRVIANTTIQNNRIVNAGDPGTATANSSSAAGIYVDSADNFLIAGNEIRRTLADGIQMVHGARNGRVIGNTIRETGDDAVGMVSYMADGDWANNSAASLAGLLDSQRDTHLVRNILVDNNDVGGNYWGRGITVVGGADISIRNNRISQVAMAAGILVAREASFITWGVNNVLVEDNTISQIQTTAPVYVPAGLTLAGGTTGHGAVEIHNFSFVDELANSSLAAALTVQNVRVARTTINQALADGVRIGVGTGDTASLSGVRDDGVAITRSFTGGPVRNLDLSALAMTDIGGSALEIASATTAADRAYCEAVSVGGVAVSDPACGGTKPVVSGSALSCAR